jgi:ABC-type amino acid transport substrate-binding protein
MIVPCNVQKHIQMAAPSVLGARLRGGGPMIIARRNLGIVSLFALAATCIFLTSAPARSQDASALSAIKSRKELKIGWAPIYPYIYRDPKTNELIGFAVDFMNDMAQSLGVKPVWVETVGRR